jgi:hypothetical protein
MAHALEELALRAEKLVKNIKKKYESNKALGRQIIAGARETADYSCGSDRWSMQWYVQYIKELETRA